MTFYIIILIYQTMLFSNMVEISFHSLCLSAYLLNCCSADTDSYVVLVQNCETMKAIGLTWCWEQQVLVQLCQLNTKKICLKLWILYNKGLINYIYSMSIQYEYNKNVYSHTFSLHFYSVLHPCTYSHTKLTRRGGFEVCFGACW